MNTRNEGIIMEPTSYSIELWRDSDFSGNWKAETAHIYRTTAKSRSG